MFYKIKINLFIRLKLEYLFLLAYAKSLDICSFWKDSSGARMVDPSPQAINHASNIAGEIRLNEVQVTVSDQEYGM